MTLTTIFARLLNMSLTASIVIVIVLGIRILLRRAPKKYSYALWAVVLFRLLCPFSLPAPMSLFQALDAPTVISGELTSVEYLPTEVMLAEPTSSDEQVIMVPAGTETATPVTVPSVSETVPVTEFAEKSFDLMGFAAMLWLFCAILLAAFGGVTYLQYRRNLVGALWVKDNIYFVDHIGTPFVAGVVRPKIYLPSTITSKEVPYILAHEQYHIRRLDHIVKLLAYFTLCVHWFNPLVWVAFILSSKDMEMSCDEAVLSKLGGHIRADYSQSLLNLALGQRIYAAAPLAFAEADTKGRVLNMAKWKKPGKIVSAACVALCVAVLVGCALNPAENNTPGDSQSPSLVGKWVMEDGGLIVNTSEIYDIYYTFRTDGTGEIFNNIPSRGTSMAFTYTLGQSGGLTITTEDTNTDYTYTIEGDTLLLDSVRYGEMNLIRVEGADISSTAPDDTTDTFFSADETVQFRWRVDDPGEIADVPVLTGTLHDMTSTDAKNAAAAFFSDDAKFWQAPQGMEYFMLEDDLNSAVPTNWKLTENFSSDAEGSSDLNMIVLDNSVTYGFRIGNSHKNYAALANDPPDVYGGKFRNSSLFIHSDYDSLLTATEAPTTKQLQAVLDTAAEMLTDLNMGNWEIVNYFVRSTKQWDNDVSKTEYNVGVVAAPVYEGVTSTLDVLSNIPQNSNSYPTVAYMLFDTDCDVRTVWFYSPMEITGKLENTSVMTTEQVMEIAKTYLAEDGYYKFKHLPDTDGTVIAEITNAEICYRREYGSNESNPFSYEYVPYILFYGNAGQLQISPSFAYANVYPNADSGNVPLFAVNAIDGSILQTGYNFIII